MRFLLATSSALAFQTSRRTSSLLGRSASSSTTRRHLSSSSPSTNAIESNRRPIRWGILSAGRISSDYVQAVSITPDATVAGIAARSQSRASEFANRHSIPNVYGSYDELLGDESIDVVYVGSIADEHATLAKESILAGKPTVVEKPLCLSLRETKELVGLARKTGTFLMEGMWTRCFPAVRKARDVIARGDIGTVSIVQGDFGWSTESCPTDDRIWNPDSGGMILDVGMYMAQLGQVAYPNAVVDAVSAMGTERNGVDHTVLTNIMYSKMRIDGGCGAASSRSSDDGVGDEKGMLQFYVTGDANTEERVVIQGTRGRIVIDPPAHVPTTVRVFRDEGRGASREEIFEYPLPDDSHAEWNYPGSIGFTHQISEVGKALWAGEKECRHFTLNDSLQVATILDEVAGQVRGVSSSGEESGTAIPESAATAT